MAARRTFKVTSELRRRFFAKVKKPPGRRACWPWTGAVSSCGYGIFEVKLTDGRWVAELAHRVAWALSRKGRGRLPPSGKQVCHDCPDGDNRLCMRSAHLWSGTAIENIADRDAKGRTARGAAVVPLTRPRGEDHYEARVTRSEVRRIRRRAAAGETWAALGLEYGMTRQGIGRIVHRQSWKHVA